MGLGDTKMGKNKPWEITADPIIVVVVDNAVIMNRMVEKWLEGRGEGGSTPILSGEGFGECKMAISGSNYSIMGLRRWGWGFVEIQTPLSYYQ